MLTKIISYKNSKTNQAKFLVKFKNITKEQKNNKKLKESLRDIHNQLYSARFSNNKNGKNTKTSNLLKILSKMKDILQREIRSRYIKDEKPFDSLLRLKKVMPENIVHKHPSTWIYGVTSKLPRGSDNYIFNTVLISLEDHQTKLLETPEKELIEKMPFFKEDSETLIKNTLEFLNQAQSDNTLKSEKTFKIYYSIFEMLFTQYDIFKKLLLDRDLLKQVFKSYTNFYNKDRFELNSIMDGVPLAMKKICNTKNNSLIEYENAIQKFGEPLIDETELPMTQIIEGITKVKSEGELLLDKMENCTSTLQVISLNDKVKLSEVKKASTKLIQKALAFLIKCQKEEDPNRNEIFEIYGTLFKLFDSYNQEFGDPLIDETKLLMTQIIEGITKVKSEEELLLDKIKLFLDIVYFALDNDVTLDLIASNQLNSVLTELLDILKKNPYKESQMEVALSVKDLGFYTVGFYSDRLTPENKININNIKCRIIINLIPLIRTVPCNEIQNKVGLLFFLHEVSTWLQAFYDTAIHYDELNLALNHTICIINELEKLKKPCINAAYTLRYFEMVASGHKQGKNINHHIENVNKLRSQLEKMDKPRYCNQNSIMNEILKPIAHLLVGNRGN